MGVTLKFVRPDVELVPSEANPNLAADLTYGIGTSDPVMSVSGSGDPGTVTNLTVIANSESSITLQWTTVDDGLGSPAKYNIRYGSPTISWGAAYGTDKQYEPGTINSTTTYEYTGLQGSTTYEFQLVAYRGTYGVDAVYGALSNKDDGTTSAPTLGTISDLNANPGDTEVILSWTAASGATAQQPQYKLSTSGTWLDFGSPLSGTAAGISVTGLTNDASYDFRIEATNGVSTTFSNIETTIPTVASDNEPAGFTELRTYDSSVVLPSLPSAPNYWYAAGGASAVQHSTFSDATAPSGNSKVYRRTYPEGLAAGGGVENIGTYGPPDWGFPLNPSEIYIRFWIRFSSGWGNQAVGTKILYLGSNNGGSVGNEMYIMFNAGSNMRLEVRVQGDVTGRTEDRNFLWSDPDNSSTAPSSANQILDSDWHLFELHIVGNTVGNQDGQIFAWLDGVKTHHFDGSLKEVATLGGDEYTFFAQNTIVSVKFDSIYGGLGGSVPAEQYIDIDDIYISGKA